MSNEAHISFGVRVTLVLTLILGMLGIQPVKSVFADTLIVTNADDGGPGSLRQAIADAVSGDTITFNSLLAGQTITLSSRLPIDKDLTIDGSGLSTRVSLSGNNLVGVLGVLSGVTVVIDSLIIKNGKDSGGAGIASVGTLIVTDSLFFGNHTVFDPMVLGAGFGGAIYNQGDLTVINSTFQDNSGSRGGAIYCNGIFTVTVTDSTFVSNSALLESGAGDGGAIFGNCDSTITGSTFSSNYAKHNGGAILTDNSISTSVITNSTFYDNTAVNTAGGIANYGGLIITNSTFSHNNSPNVGAIHNGLGGVLSLRNSILANSVGGVDCLKSDSTPDIENINNLIETTGQDLESCGTSLLTDDPELGALQDNGGFTQTMALSAGSPAIDSGDDENCEPVDQRGVERPQGSHCDMGAFEYQFPSFTDVPVDYWAWMFVERLYFAGITDGCNTNPLQYCPEGTVTRAQMAVFLLRGIHGSSYAPPAVGGSTGFGDVAVNYWAAAWIKQLAAEGITGGCGSGSYCPEAPLTRGQMAVFLLRAKYGAGYTPPGVGGSTGFGDVDPTYWAGAWIKQLAAEGITGGCGGGNYCPEAAVTRAQMAVFIVRTFGIPLP